MIGTKTYQPKPDAIEEKWYLIDASGAVLGRLASRVAAMLRGKHKPQFAPHVDPKVHCVVINTDKIKLTGTKWESKKYFRHSGWVGGLRKASAKELYEKKPQKLLEIAVKGMLPHNSLGRKLLLHLHLYTGDKHPHQAQNPEVIKITK